MNDVHPAKSMTCFTFNSIIFNTVCVLCVVNIKILHGTATGSRDHFDRQLLEWHWTNGTESHEPINSSISPASGINRGDKRAWPGARTGATSWYDTIYNTAWVYGGVGFTGRPTRRAGVLGDLWSYNTHTGVWTDVTSSIPVRPPLSALSSPPARFDSVLCGVHGIIVVLHGGLSELGAPLDDTWIFDQVKLTWMQIESPATGPHMFQHPIPRRNPLSWCLRDRMVLYGGLQTDGLNKHNLTDMWEFHFDCLQWNQIIPDSGDHVMPNVTVSTISWTQIHLKQLQLVLLEPIAIHRWSSQTTCTHAIWTYDIHTHHWFRSLLINHAFCTGSVACVHWKGESDDIWIFSGAKSFCRGAPLSDEDTGTHTGPPQVNNQLWIIAKSGGNKITSTYTVQSALPFYVPSSAQPSARCGAVSWSSNHTTYVWAGLGFDVHQRLWYRNDLWRLNTVPRPITTPTVALKQTTVTLPGSWIQTLSPSNVFLLCFTAMSGTALMFGLVLFLKKMFVDYPQHTPSRNFKVRYSPLTQEALFENGGI